MSEQRITLAHGPDGYVVQATASGFDPDSDADRAVLEALKAMIDDRPNVIAFDDSIEVHHVFPEDAVRARVEAVADRWHQEASEAKAHGTPNALMSKRNAARTVVRALLNEETA